MWFKNIELVSWLSDYKNVDKLFFIFIFLAHLRGGYGQMTRWSYNVGCLGLEVNPFILYYMIDSNCTVLFAYLNSLLYNLSLFENNVVGG